MTKRTPPYSPEVRERAVRMVFEHRDEYASQYEAILSIAAKIGCSRETLRNWVRVWMRDLLGMSDDLKGLGQSSRIGRLEAPIGQFRLGSQAPLHNLLG